MILLFFRKLGEYGKREDFLAGKLGLRKIADAISKLFEALL